MKRNLGQMEIRKIPDKEPCKTSEDIAIIGIGAKLSGSDSVAEFWELLMQGRHMVKSFPQSRAEGIDDFVRKQYTNLKGYHKGAYLDHIDLFDAAFFGFTPKEADLMDPNQRLFLETCYTALEDAGYGGTALSGSKTGVFLGFGNDADYQKLVYEYENRSFGMALTGVTPAMIPSRIAYLLDFHGPALNIDTACSSSLTAVHYACRSIQQGECDQAVAGAVKVNLLPVDFGLDIGISASDAVTRTFDDDANGTVGGEGVIAFLLKPLKQAIARKDRVYAVIKGSAVNQDGRSNGITAPNPLAQERVLLEAWENAGIHPETLGYLEAHGTATNLGDPIEISAITNAFRRKTNKSQFCAIGSLKTNTGHLDHASGLAGLLKAVLCLKHKMIPASLHLDYPNRNIDFISSPVYINKRNTRWKSSADFPRRCGVSSFGLSGTNCHIVLEESPGACDQYTTVPADFCILTVSAKSEQSFLNNVKHNRDLLQQADSFEELQKICYTSNVGRGHDTYRLAAIFQKDDWRSSLQLDFLEKGKQFYHAMHQVIPFNKQQRQQGDLTQEEKEQLSEQAKALIREILNQGKPSVNVLKSLCTLYVSGAEVPWVRLSPLQPKAQIPSYAFEHRHHWVHMPALSDRLFYMPVWKDIEDVEPQTSILQKRLVILTRDSALYDRAMQSFDNHKAIMIVLNDFLTDSDGEKKLRDKFQEVPWNEIGAVLHLASVEKEAIGDRQRDSTVTDCLDLVKIVRILNEFAVDPIPFYGISHNAFAVDGDQKVVFPFHAMYCAALRTLSAEYPRIPVKCIDIDRDTELSCVIPQDPADTFLSAVRANTHYRETICRSFGLQQAEKAVDWGDSGVFLIAGGTGKIGVRLARMLAQKHKGIRIALTARSLFPEAERWNALAEDQRTNRNLREKLDILLEARMSGAEVMVFQADVSQEEEMYELVSRLEDDYGRISGIFFCAAEGVGGAPVPADQIRRGDFIKRTAAKVIGARSLYLATKHKPPQFFCLFSSMITFTGSAGGLAYTASNAFLDSFAHYLLRTGMRATVINWPTWSSTVTDEEAKLANRSQVFEAIRDVDALHGISEVVDYAVPQIIIGQPNAEPAVVKSLAKAKFRLSDEIMESLSGRSDRKAEPYETSAENRSAVCLHGKDDKRYTATERLVGDMFASILGYDTLNVYDSFTELGANSLLFIQMQLHLEEKGICLQEDDFYRYPSINSLSAMIDGTELAQVQQKVPSDASKSPFNELFFKSCFYHSLFSALQRLNRCVTPFLWNEMYHYRFEKDKGYIAMREQGRKTDAQLLEQMGISLIGHETISCRQLREMLIDGAMAIVWVDCFYEPNRADTYQTQHLAHTLLLTGYDHQTELFDIIEHSNKDGLDYREQKIHSDDLLHCMKGFHENYKVKGFDEVYSCCCYCILEESPAPEEEDPQKLYAEHREYFNEHLEEYCNSFAAIEEFCNYFSKFPGIDAEQLQLVNIMLNQIMNYKLIEHNRLRKVTSEDDPIWNAFCSVFDIWKLLRNLLVRIELSKRYDEFDMEGFLEHLQSVINEENRFSKVYAAAGSAEKEERNA